MTATVFPAFVAFVAMCLVGVVVRWLPRRQATGVAVVLVAWLLYVGTLGWSGVLARTSRPPGIVFLVVPIVLALFAIVRSAWAARIAERIPLWELLAFQTFRVGVELFLYRLWLEARLRPDADVRRRERRHPDRASAPVVAWAATRGRIGLRVALAWNVLGLLVLANVIVRSALTAPGPLHLLAADHVNRAIGTFPYTYIAGFLAPLAIALHVLALRSIARRLRDGSRAGGASLAVGS